MTIRSQRLRDRKSTRLNSSHRCISYAVFCLKKHLSEVFSLAGSGTAPIEDLRAEYQPAKTTRAAVMPHGALSLGTRQPFLVFLKSRRPPEFSTFPPRTSLRL